MAPELQITPPPPSATKTLSSAEPSPIRVSSKGLEETVPESYASSSSSSSASSDSDQTSSDSDSDSESEASSSSGSASDQEDHDTPYSLYGPVSEEHLRSLLEKAKESMRLKASTNTKGKGKATFIEEDEIRLDADEEDDYLTKELPDLDPGELPPGYFDFDAEKPEDGIPPVRDAEVEALESVSSVPAPPKSPAVGKDGRKLTKKEVKELKKKNAKPGWFDLPTPDAADLPRLHREVEALRLRNSLDPKRFYRKDPGEGKGVKGLPKQFAIGTILPTETPFGTASNDNLPRADRKRTLVDELVDDAETKRYAKKKFEELQSTRASRGRGTFRKRFAGRKPRW